MRPDPGFRAYLRCRYKVSFAARAHDAPSPFADVSPTLPDHTLAAVKFIVEMGDEMPGWRLQQSAMLRRVAASVQPLSKAILAACPDRLRWVGGSSPNPAFACLVIDALDLPCTAWPAMMYEFGFSIVGDAPDTGLWRLRTKPELLKSARSVDPAHLRSGTPDRTTVPTPGTTHRKLCTTWNPVTRRRGRLATARLFN